MHLTSVYEYLELRYSSRLVRWLGSLTFLLTIILYLGVALYAPCVRLDNIAVEHQKVLCTMYIQYTAKQTLLRCLFQKRTEFL